MTLVTILPYPYLETPKEIATKSGQTHVLDRAVPSCKFLCRSERDMYPYRGLPWGLPSHAIHFWKALVEPRRADVTPYLTCNAATYRFRDICCKNLRFGGKLGVPPKGRRPPRNIMQNFTPIGVAVAEISATGEIQTVRHRDNYSRLNIRQNAY